SLVRVARRELVLDVLVPQLREARLRGLGGSAEEVAREELDGSQVRKLRRLRVVVLAAHAREGVILFGVVVERDERVRVERRVNFRLRFRGAELVSARDVQHERRAYVRRLVERGVNADAVVADRAVGTKARRE